MLPAPTVELVKAECDAFDRESFLDEDALGQLRASFPRNTDTAHVLLKVVVLNKLYSTRIKDIDVRPLAIHIAGLGIDPFIAQGSPHAVDLITNCPKMRRYYCFATKFCSWHNPTAYPIYDGNVDKCLWLYMKQDRFEKFHHEDLISYDKFLAVVTAFRSFYSLPPLITFKQLDKFLWRLGEKSLKEASWHFLRVDNPNGFGVVL